MIFKKTGAGATATKSGAIMGELIRGHDAMYDYGSLLVLRKFKMII